MAFNPIWHGPGWPYNCDDRTGGHTRYAPPLQNAPGAPPLFAAAGLPPVAGGPTIVGVPCSDNLPQMVNVPVPLPAGRTAAHYSQGACINFYTRHGAAHRVCGQCIDYTEDQQWYKLAIARMTKRPPQLTLETNKWRGFWTRMCTQCERRERILCSQRQGTGGMVIIPPRPTNWGMMANYPTNTCTCVARLNLARLCNDHRRDRWNWLRDKMVKRRTENEQWLFTSAWNPTAGVARPFCTAAPARLNDRKHCQNMRFRRGCRCGKEVTPAQNPRVYQCMACEGIIHVAPVGAIPPVAIGHPLSQNSASPGRPLRLRRDRGANLW